MRKTARPVVWEGGGLNPRHSTRSSFVKYVEEDFDGAGGGEEDFGGGALEAAEFVGLGGDPVGRRGFVGGEVVEDLQAGGGYLGEIPGKRFHFSEERVVGGDGLKVGIVRGPYGEGGAEGGDVRGIGGMAGSDFAREQFQVAHDFAFGAGGIDEAIERGE